MALSAPHLDFSDLRERSGADAFRVCDGVYARGWGDLLGADAP